MAIPVITRLIISIPLLGVLETSSKSGFILARINVNVHSLSETLAGLYCQIANAGDLEIYCDLVRNKPFFNNPMIPANIFDNVYKVCKWFLMEMLGNQFWV